MIEGADLAAEEADCRARLAEPDPRPETFDRLARVLAAQDRPAEAAGVLRQRLARADDPLVAGELGRLLIRCDRHDMAQGEVPRPFDLNFPWGRFPFPTREHYPAERTLEAVGHLRRAAADPAGSEARALLGLVLVQDLTTVREGAELLQTAVHEAPANPDAHLGMALLGVRQGDWRLAAAAAGAAANRRPGDPRASAVQAFA
ncbi:MAG: tetratricopeptide repeat protein, partial [Rhodospirillaceae bacterium]